MDSKKALDAGENSVAVLEGSVHARSTFSIRKKKTKDEILK
jgi:hypothetical protein